MDKLRMMSKDNVQDNIKKIQKLFPNAVTEVLRDGKPTLAVDFDVLKQEMSSVLIDDHEERYQMTWPDKKKSILLANTPISATLRPCKEESVDFDHTQNLYIEGDNLDVLKLLQETYLGKIKMIYIDPPYNTGNDFVYNDDFRVESEEWNEMSGDYDEQGNRLFQNTESNGRFHTDWLNMIYPRLKVAKDLLADDGVIFVSIDENEYANLKTTMDSVFGEINYVDTFLWNCTFRPSNFTKTTRKNVEYILCYSCTQIELQGKFEDTQGEFSLTKKKHNPQILSCPENYVRANFSDGTYKKGNYNSGYQLLNDITVRNGLIVNKFDILIEQSIWGQTYLEDEIRKGVDLIIKSEKTMALYARKSYQQSELKPTTLLPKEEVGDVLEANSSLSKLLGKEIFDYPKPVTLIKYLINIIKNNKDSIILDFFSGSATTAHAVMQLNAEDGGNRKFIMVQLPEKCDENSEAFKAGFRTICDIGKERIRRAGKKIKAENPSATGLDIGFRVLKLDSSNMKDIYYKPSDYSQGFLDQLEDNIKADRTPLDLLFQVMLELGKPLSAKIEENEIADKKVFVVDDNDLIACFDENITEDVVKAIAQKKPLYAVFRDSSLSSDAVAVNFDQIFATYSPTTTRKVL